VIDTGLRGTVFTPLLGKQARDGCPSHTEPSRGGGLAQPASFHKRPNRNPRCADDIAGRPTWIPCPLARSIPALTSRIVRWSLFALAAYVILHAGYTLLTHAEPTPLPL